MVELTESVAVGLLDDDKERLAHETTQLWTRAPIGFAGTIVNGLIAIGILRTVVDKRTRWGWFGALLVLTGIRYVQRRYFLDRVGGGRLNIARWKGIFDLGIGVCGFAWGSSAIFLYADSVPHQTFLAFVLGGMVAGATATFATNLTTFVAFSVPALAPLIIRFVGEGDELHIAMGGMVFLFGVLLTGTAQLVSTLSAESFATQSKAPRELEATPVPWLSRPEKTVDDAGEKLHRTVNRAVLHEQKHRSMTTLLTGIVQNFAKPVHVITESVRYSSDFSVLANRAPTPADLVFRIDSAVQDIYRSLQRLAELASQSESNREKTPIGEFVASAIYDWREAHGFTGKVQLKLHRVGEVTIDRREWRDSLAELLTNAREASVTTGGEIRVDVRQAHVDEIASERAFVHSPTSSEQYVAIAIADTGEGIPSEALERIFDPYFSSKSDTRGLGLPLVAAIARRHDAEITIDGGVGRGTTVTVYLPAVKR